MNRIGYAFLINAIPLFSVITACTTILPMGKSTPPTVVAINGERAVQLAIQGCRVPHLVLIGEPKTTKATLMSLAEADKMTSEKGESTSYSQPMTTTVWLVQVEGLFQRVGGPLLANGLEPTPSPPWAGVCLAIVDANKGDVFVIRNRPK